MISVLEILFIVVIFLTNIIQAITGFAGNVVAMPFALRLVGGDVARPVLNAASLFVCIIVAVAHFKDIRWKSLGFMILFVGIGFGLGFLLPREFADNVYITKAYGMFILLFAVMCFFFNMDEVKIPTWVLCIGLIFAGVLHQLFVSGGPLVVIYARLRFKDKNAFRATLSAMWVILNSILLGEHIAWGLWSWHLVLLLGLGIAVSFAATFIGKAVVKKINANLFMKITYVLLFISGFSLLV